MKNLLDKCCGQNQNTDFMFSNFFSENHAVYEKMWENMMRRVGLRLLYNMAHAHCMPDTHS